jgi:hypothetical protein
MNLYCIHCGFPNSYAFTKPVTCGKCKKSLEVKGVASKPQVKQTASASTKRTIRTPHGILEYDINDLAGNDEDYEYEGSDSGESEEIPDVQGLNFSITSDGPTPSREGISLEKVIFEQAKPRQKTPNPKPAKKLNSKKVFKELMQKAASSRKN